MQRTNPESDHLVPGPDAARRVRAAIAYSGQTQPAVAEAAQVSYTLLRHIVNAKRPAGGTLDRLYRIADACEVPQWFMRHGFPEDFETAIALSEGRDGPSAPEVPNVPLGDSPRDDDPQRHAS